MVNAFKPRTVYQLTLNKNNYGEYTVQELVVLQLWLVIVLSGGAVAPSRALEMRGVKFAHRRGNGIFITGYGLIGIGLLPKVIEDISKILRKEKPFCAESYTIRHTWRAGIDIYAVSHFDGPHVGLVKDGKSQFGICLRHCPESKMYYGIRGALTDHGYVFEDYSHNQI